MVFGIELSRTVLLWGVLPPGQTRGMILNLGRGCTCTGSAGVSVSAHRHIRQPAAAAIHFLEAAQLAAEQTAGAI